MKYQKVLNLADQFVTLADKTEYLSPVNVEFKAQRDRFSEFYNKMRTSLRSILGNMGGEITVLQARGFDPQMMKLFNKAYHDLIEIGRTLNEDNPYASAELLVRYVLGKPNGPILDNLDFLAKHHLTKTNEDFAKSKLLTNPKITVFEQLKILATYLQRYMKEYPAVQIPGKSNRPPAALSENVMNISPENKAAPDTETNPGIPSAKKLMA